MKWSEESPSVPSVASVAWSCQNEVCPDPGEGLGAVDLIMKNK